MCNQFNPNPHEFDVGDSLGEMAPNMSGAAAQHAELVNRIRAFLQSPQVRALSPAEQAELRQRTKAILKTLTPHLLSGKFPPHLTRMLQQMR